MLGNRAVRTGPRWLAPTVPTLLDGMTIIDTTVTYDRIQHFSTRYVCGKSCHKIASL